MEREGQAQAPRGVADAGETGRFEIRGVAKRFGETVVLRGVDLGLTLGRVHGLVGANGAGKTTLMRILVGELRGDAGSLRADDAEVAVDAWSAPAARRAGIAMVHQEVPVFDNLKVYEHFALATRDAVDRSWRARARERATAALERVFPQAGIDADAAVEALTLAQRQMLEIALAVDAPGLRLLVLDEPTSALGRDQVEALKVMVGRLRDAGVGVLLVTHRLEEILGLCDDITVLRDGAVARSDRAAAFDAASLIEAMGGVAAANAGGPAEREREGPTVQTGAADAVVARLEPAAGAPADARPLVLRRGEIVGLSGLSGSGQRELLLTLLGRSRAEGVVRAAFVSGDRRGEGVFALWSTLRNVTVQALGALRRGPAISGPAERDLYERWRRELRIVAADPADKVTTLSGGNQQKVLIARALAAEPELLLLDDPTRGVDAATKAELYERLRRVAADGRGVLWYSTDDEEMRHCDRVYVMRDGFVRGELVGDQIRREAIVAASFDGAAAACAADGEGRWSPPAAAERVFNRARPVARIAASGWFLAAAVLAALVVVTAFAQASALSPSGLPILVSSFLPLVLAAAAETSIIAVSDIDLGVGAFMGLINAVSATWLVSRPLEGAAAIFAFAMLYTAQALVVALRRVPAIIVTLGASFVWLGIALMILPTPGGTSPAWLTAVGNLSLPVVPEPIAVAFAVALIMTLVLFRSRAGVRLRAVGNSAEAYAVRAGSVAAVKARLGAYALAAVFAVLAGLSMTALTSSADPNASAPDTLLGIASVIIGGGAFIGGRVDPVGSVLGALMFGLLAAVLGLTSINVNYTSLIEGAVLIAVLAMRLVVRREVRS
jgi:ribose transport system ATP-binding protein